MKYFIQRLIVAISCLVTACTEIHASAKAGEATVNVGATTTITLATAYQTTLRNSTGISARWSTNSSNINITSQTNTSCTIKGIAIGTAQVNYYCSYYINGYYRTMDFYYTVTISGSSNGPTSICISPTSLSLTEGDTYTVTATQTGAIGGTYFTTSSSSVASVSTGSTSGYKTTGTVTAQGAGSCYIYAKTMNGLSSSCYVTVKAKQVVATSISAVGPDKMTVGETFRLSSVYAPSNAMVSLQYESDHPNVVTVTSSGLLTAIAVGTANIIVTETVSKLKTSVAVEVVEAEVPVSDISEMDNVIYIEDVSGSVGQELTLSIKMKNTVPIQGFGFDLYLPDGITISKDEDGLNRVTLSTARTTEKKTNYFDSNVMTDGGLRVLASSTGGYTIDGNDGEVVRVVVEIGNDVKEGDYPIVLKEVVLSDAMGSGFETDFVKFTLSVTEKDTDISQLDNVVYIEKTEGRIGSQLTLSVNMKNNVEVQGFGFDLYLPDGVSVAKDDDGFYLVALSNERTTEKKTDYFDSNIMASGALRVLASSTGGYTISGIDGEIVKVTICISKDMKEGDYPVILREIALSDNNSNGYETEYVKSTLTITDYILGDANGDTKINVVDFTAIANYVLGKSLEGFIEKAADLNEDGKVNVVDLTAVANLILYGNTKYS